MVFLYWSIFKVSVISINKQLVQSSVSLLSILNGSRRTKFHSLPFCFAATAGDAGADAADVSIAAHCTSMWICPGIQTQFWQIEYQMHWL